MHKGLVASVVASSADCATGTTGGPATNAGRPVGDRGGLARLAEWLGAGHPGVREVFAQDDLCVDAVDAHVRRLARRLGLRVLRADTRSVDCGARELLLGLGISTPAVEAHVVARALAEAGPETVLLWVGGVASTFDRACLEHLRAESGVQVLTISVEGSSPPRLAEETLRVARDMSDMALWWAEIVGDAQRNGTPMTLGRAESMWQGSGGVPSADSEVSERHGVEGVELARAMLRSMPDDPWVSLRAGAILLASGERGEAQSRFGELIAHPGYEELRPDFWRLWKLAVGQLEGEAREAAAIHAAECAISLEEGPAADAFAELVSESVGPGSFDMPWILGRTQLLRSDPKAARASLECAVARATEPSLRWLAQAHLAEACLLDGDAEAASKHAEPLLACEVPRARLLARNIMGKLILAKGTPQEAEAHFARDELEARQHGLDRERMRASLNRAVALLTQSDAARAASLLEDVLRCAGRTGDIRAQAMAHLNLGVAKQLSRDYESAIAHHEAAFELGTRSGDRIAAYGAARNLAELRTMFGMLDEAWQTLQFVRRSAPKTITPSRRVGLALVAARILLERGDASAASVEVTDAIALSDRAALQRMTGDCQRLAARVALHEGDLGLAASAIENAQASASDAYAEAEVALLRARLARAQGADGLEHARQAKACALQADDEELLLEVNLLLAQLSLSVDRLGEARRHARSAAAVRDRLARRVSGAVRQAYLSRPQSLAVDAVLASCGPVRADAPPSAPRPIPSKRARVFVGEHPSVVALLAKTRRVAKSDAPVLIRGESGTGKELIAELLHDASDRSDGPFVAVNCAALVETLLLSELFGHERGAFTGAVGRKRGRFEVADGGTLFLDEIGDISPGAQAALLRVLQSQTFHRVGGTTALHTDARVICATHRDLDFLVARGEFRQDLYYRLCGIPLDVPPLRERGNDVVALAQYVLDTMAADGVSAPRQLSTAARRVLTRHTWPGNVRELENVIRAAAILSDGPTIEEEGLVEHVQPGSVRQPLPSGPVSIDSVRNETDFVRGVYQAMRYLDVPLPDLKRRIEEGCIALAMDDADGQITRAAGYLGMKRPRVSQLVKAYGLKLEDKDR